MSADFILDVHSASKDTWALIRWVARLGAAAHFISVTSDDGEDDGDEMYCYVDEHDPLISCDDGRLLQRLERKLRNIHLSRFHLTADEVRCLLRVIESAQYRLGRAENLGIERLMNGHDGADPDAEGDLLPCQPDADPDQEYEELNSLHDHLDSNEVAA